MHEKKILNKPAIVVSAINLFEGGPLSVLKDCLDHLKSDKYKAEYTIIALVHKKSLFDQVNYPNVVFFEFPKSRKAYVFRLYYEYIYFKKFAKNHNIAFWLSLHDISPRLVKIPQAVYCHNSTPFNTINIKDIYIQPKQFFFRLFYKYLYMINIKSNKNVIVQQLWLKENFQNIFGIDKDIIVVSKPQVQEIPKEYLFMNTEAEEKMFFFPTFPRPFKNIEVICEAVKLLSDNNIDDFKVLITIDGSENIYAKYIFDQYKNLNNIVFLGLIKRDEVYKLYAKSDCLIFPSKLESWGLPITEFKQFNKPIFVADLPYAKETIGEYKKAIFFKPSDAKQLAQYMEKLIKETEIDYEKTKPIKYPQPFAENWDQLFNILLSN